MTRFSFVPASISEEAFFAGIVEKILKPPNYINEEFLCDMRESTGTMKALMGRLK